ncbi:MAG: sigma-70 family RNA polymerase sigma factor [Candidatus Omnitrophica bacterium]|nr:sigma-70 family RNA polymerase sigma factor [Candidatus Omnitrophota bacterium]
MEFTRLYNRLAPRLRQIARRLKTRVAFVDEDDLFQEMCIYLWKKYQQGIPEHLNDRYVINGCNFHINNYLRKMSDNVYMLSLEHPMNDDGQLLRDTLCEVTEPLYRSLDRKMTFEEIKNNGFSKREKQVLDILTQGYTVREAARQLGISHVMVVKYKKRLVDKWQRKEGAINGKCNLCQPNGD